MLGVLLLAAFAGAQSRVAASPLSAAALSAHWQPQRLVNGSPILFRITSQNPLQSLTGEWLGHEVVFSFDGKTKIWSGFAGVSLGTKPGIYVLQLTGTTLHGKDISFQQKVSVTRTHYPKINIAVAKQYTEPAPEQLQKIKEDKSVKEERFKSVSLEREWSGRFLPPVDARISDVFGTQRVINGKAQSTHQGLDYAVPTGTPVAALNSGTVLLARSLFFEGNCVVIDHGQGLLTLYLHLSEFAVKEGDHIKRGQELGLSGGTGRATGPHLHIAVRWQGIYLNPATMLKLNLP
ncbi:MAG: hypothetical protein NVS1B11_18470 [Terriglobales bacterium]